MKLFDVNTAIGHWPFRQVPNRTAGELRAILEHKGIRAAVVANTHGLFYKNCHDANLELAEQIADHGDFFVGAATLNPMYAAWRRDLRACRHRLGLRALRLAPQYHDYRLGCEQSVAIAQAAAELGMAILVPERVVDLRQRHWMDADREVRMEEVGALCKAVPAARVIVTESWFRARWTLTGEGELPYPNLYFESSRVGPSDLPAEVAAAHVVFGTGAPLKSITSAVLKLELSDLSPDQKLRIAWGNAAEMLGLPAGPGQAAPRPAGPE